MDDSASKIPTAIDYLLAELSQPELPGQPTLETMEEEQSFFEKTQETRTIRRKDAVTGRFKRVRTDGKPRREHYSDSGEVLE